MEPTKQLPSSTAHDLPRVVTEVLGNLAFMISDAEVDEPAVGTLWMQAEIRYEGPLFGTLRCWTTRAFATRLAANLLGIETEDGEAQIAAEDALREFMNVLCGQVVTQWHGTAGIFNLSIPIVRECLMCPEVQAGQTHSLARCSIDGEPFVCFHEPGRPEVQG